MSKEEVINNDKDAIKSSLFLVPGLVMYELMEAVSGNKEASHNRIGDLLGVSRVLAEKAIPKEKLEMVVESFDSVKKINKYIESIKGS